MSWGRCPSRPQSFALAIEDGERVVEGRFHPSEVTNVVPVDGVWVVAEVVVGQLLQARANLA